MDMELAEVIAVDRVGEIAVDAFARPLGGDAIPHTQRDQPKQECGRHHEPCELHPVGERLVCVEKVLPEVVAIHRLTPNHSRSWQHSKIMY